MFIPNYKTTAGTHVFVCSPVEHYRRVTVWTFEHVINRAGRL